MNTTTRRATKLSVAVLMFASWLAPQLAQAARLKDLAEVEGARPNHLVGVGIVVGLAGTGDDASSFISKRPLATVLRNLGTTIDAADIRARNVAAVMVTAELPPFAKPGTRLDVSVSSIGTARSLSGGTLIATGLKGLDREIYAFAQGPLTTGGWEATSSLSGSVSRKNHVTVAKIPAGGIVEREVPTELPADRIMLHLREPDFTTATRIREAITASLGTKTATVVDPGVVAVAVGAEWKGRVVELVAKIEALEATPDAPARVVIDERTGTIVVGNGVTLGPAAISYGGLSISVRERFDVSQPNALSLGRSVTLPDASIEVREDERKMQVVPSSATVDDVAKALNALGVKPRDLFPILQALKAAGALRAELTVL